jgi:hypothetical protein
MYCPERILTRAESAVFVERGLQGAEFLPPQPAQRTFDDVSLAEWYAKWVQSLFDDGFTAGCGTNPLIYCPSREHTRAEGSVFFLRMKKGKDFEPPAASGLFSDVPMEAWYARWVEQAYLEGILKPCETEPALRACPNDPLDRAMGAYMMVKSKNLEGPAP